jgi:hypothetical protein
MLATAERRAISTVLEAMRAALKPAFDGHTWPDTAPGAASFATASLQTLKNDVLRALLRGAP